MWDLYPMLMTIAWLRNLFCNVIHYMINYNTVSILDHTISWYTVYLSLFPHISNPRTVSGYCDMRSNISIILWVLAPHNTIPSIRYYAIRSHSFT